ncbi:uridine kinase family protein [Klenkia taihuensis]|uniref:AAA domain-containing protein n=1 Tax=Klenkia taihuensis TaxID=1225127 RepID=A0A1I1TJS1_9ACTN|nr:AAA family ATPase [Klenkia taihuensis]GHE12734.1 adenylate kinase [Klenkia taihuensis]SFD58824.1 AAA domain-containing protein [Klenkia taihuensis]
MRLAELADRVRAAPARLGGTRLVLVDGPAGSGKTTLAQRLAGALDAPVVHLDDLYAGWTLDGVVDRLTRWVLEPVAAGRDAVFDAYDWHAGAFRVPTTVPAGPVLVVEGCGAGARELADRVSLLVWVEAPPEVCARRWADRGGAAMTAFQPDWARAEAAVFAREGTRARADVRVDGAPAHDPGPDGVAVLG